MNIVDLVAEALAPGSLAHEILPYAVFHWTSAEPQPSGAVDFNCVLGRLWNFHGLRMSPLAEIRCRFQTFLWKLHCFRSQNRGCGARIPFGLPTSGSNTPRPRSFRGEKIDSKHIQKIMVLTLAIDASPKLMGAAGRRSFLQRLLLQIPKTEASSRCNPEADPEAMEASCSFGCRTSASSPHIVILHSACRQNTRPAVKDVAENNKSSALRIRQEDRASCELRRASYYQASSRRTRRSS